MLYCTVLRSSAAVEICAILLRAHIIGSFAEFEGRADGLVDAASRVSSHSGLWSVLAVGPYLDAAYKARDVSDGGDRDAGGHGVDIEDIKMVKQNIILVRLRIVNRRPYVQIIWRSSSPLSCVQPHAFVSFGVLLFLNLAEQERQGGEGQALAAL